MRALRLPAHGAFMKELNQEMRTLAMHGLDAGLPAASHRFLESQDSQ
jgi:hypothetical protein